jgi:hypothetical protein
MTMRVPATQGPWVDEAAGSGDERVSLLTEIEFKWLMAGQGWWIDTTRFHSDPSYAACFLGLALASQSVALRESATLLQAQLDALAPGSMRPDT